MVHYHSTENGDSEKNDHENDEIQIGLLCD